MPKNIKGGNKTKSQKNSNGPAKAREIPVPEQDDDSHVAIVTKKYGDGRFECQIVNFNGLQPAIYPSHMSSGTRNKYARGIIVGAGTYVLMSIRSYQKTKADIIFVYKDTELSYLVENNHIVINTTLSENVDFEFTDAPSEQKDDGFDFTVI